MTRARLIGLALLYTLLNVPKPLTVDDGAYYYFARQIAHDPLHPYDFSMFWYTWPQPANEVLAPPVLPYWLGACYAVVGEQPWLWKLALLPFALAFVGALYGLSRRLAKGMEWPVVLLVVLSPLFLPSFNLMLDVPAFALGLTSLAVFLRACGRRSLVLAMLAGVAAGLAMQTKYTALVTPAVLTLYALLTRRLLLGIVAALTAAGVFVGIESFLWSQGESHFLVNLKQSQHEQQLEYKLAVARALLPMVGGVTPGLILLALAGLGARGWLVAIAGVLLALTYAAVGIWQLPASDGYAALETDLFGFWGIALTGLLLAATWRLLWPTGTDCASLRTRLTLFALLWLLLEVAAYVPLAPFPAARRVMGVVVAATFVLGRLAAFTCQDADRRRVVHGAVAGGVLAGLLFYGVDLIDAAVQRNAPEAAARCIAEQPAGERSAKVWYTGHWGFQYYAERAGMTPVVPFHPRQPFSILQPGDWLVVPEDRWNQQYINVEPGCVSSEQAVVIGRTVPWRTVQCFYGGYVPLEHHEGRRILVTIYRVTHEWVPTAR